MKITHLALGIAILLWGASTSTAQIFSLGNCDPCEPVACDPCEPVCGATGSLFSFGGWLEAGVYTNSHSVRMDNGPMHTKSRKRTDFNLGQLGVYGEKEMDTRRGFDWGGKIVMVYGSHGGSMQTSDGTFDADWGTNRHGYAMSAYNVYGTLGYYDLSVKFGKFTTPIGWESSNSVGNFFYSHSYCYYIEPATHMGVVASYQLTDRFSFDGGWVTGEDSSFDNPFNNKGFLGGFTYELADNAAIYYQMSAGTGRNYFYGDKDTNADKEVDYFMQSFCFEWMPTDQFTYVMQYNLRNHDALGGARTSAYGINNHFLYQLSKTWATGLRFEWMRESGLGWINEGNTDFYQLTWGWKWDPADNLSIRPEVRYDWARSGDTPYADGTRSDQVSGGLGIVYTF